MTAAREACRELRCMVEAINADRAARPFLIASKNGPGAALDGFAGDHSAYSPASVLEAIETGEQRCRVAKNYALKVYAWCDGIGLVGIRPVRVRHKIRNQ